MGYIKALLPHMIQYKAARYRLARPGTPINLTFSVTNICQSRCKTCNIWKIYRDQPDKRHTELNIQEIEKIFQTIGHVYIFNVSGGEPFLREDFPEIIKLACKYLSPGIIHIPTNAIATQKIKTQLADILTHIRANHPQVHLTVKPSLDHIGKKHDHLRGVPGNFNKVLTLFDHLKALKPDFPQLHAELGTVISRWNIMDIEEISRYITSTLSPDSYRNEIAEQRSEMCNQNDPITPNARDYDRAIRFFVSSIRVDMDSKVMFQKLTNAFRLVYYQLAIGIMKEKRQVIPCYAGISNAHMTPYGDIWPCCTLGYEKSMGNLREFGYNFHKLWNSALAGQIRREIKAGQCYCPLANQAYSNILMDAGAMKNIFTTLFRLRLR